MSEEVYEKANAVVELTMQGHLQFLVFFSVDMNKMKVLQLEHENDKENDKPSRWLLNALHSNPDL